MSSIEIDSILTGDPARIGAALLALPEDQWFERKSMRVRPEVFARALVGLANAEGGVVVIGLGEGRVEDTARATKAVNALRQTPHSHTAPPVRVRFEEVVAAAADGTPATLVVARVQPGEALHELTNGEVYLRVSDATMKLSAAQREELAYDRGGAHFEAKPLPGIGFDDLSKPQLRAYAGAIGSAGPPKNVLAARALLTPQGKVTTAAYLLFGNAPQRQLPHAHVRILRWGSTERGSGAHQSLIEGGDRRIEGTVPHVIARSADTIEELLPQRRALRADGRFGPVPIVPRDAWLEGLVNAVVHRSYSMSGDHIRVDLFPDRVEIESPGRFPGIVDPTRPLDITRYARNPRIARVCADVAITQELGEGIRRIFAEMRDSGLTDPAYRQTAGSVRLILTARSRLPANVALSLPNGAGEVLRTIQAAAKPVGTGELVDLTGISRPTLLRILRALRDADLVEWSGKSTRDPRATWSTLPH